MSSKLSQLLSNAPLTGADAAAADGLYIYDASASGTDRSKGITLAEFVKALRTRSAQANSSGNTTVTPGVLSIIHTEILTLSGAGSTTRLVILAIPTGLSAGARCAVRCVVPATTSITVEFRNATSGGTLLTSFVTDTSGDDKVAEFEFDGTQWNFLRFDAYATA